MVGPDGGRRNHVMDKRERVGDDNPDVSEAALLDPGPRDSEIAQLSLDAEVVHLRKPLAGGDEEPPLAESHLDLDRAVVAE